MNMASDRETREEVALDALFEAAAATRPAPSDDFLARLTAQAEAAVPVAARPAPTRPARGWHLGLREFFAATGLSGAAVLGVWIGFAMPEILPLTSTEDTAALYTFFPGADLTVALSE